MNENIKVSIIVPMYNVEKYLENCLNTIIGQTHKNLEIILVDDGSPDNSGKIADEYAIRDERIKVIHQQNKGVSSARNAGLDIASGEYICFADSDDHLMEDYVDYLLSLCLQFNVDIALTKEMYTNFYSEQVQDENVHVYSGEEATVDILLYNIPIGVYCKLFKRSFLEENKIRFLPHIFIGEGFNFNTAAFQRAEKVCVSNRRIYYYRRDNPTSATTKFSIKKWENGLLAIETIKQNFVLHSKKLDIAWNYADWHTHCDVVNLMIMAKARKDYPEMYKKCRKVARSKGKYAFKIKLCFREKVRAIILMFFPHLMPKLILARNKRYAIDNQQDNRGN